MGDNIDRQACDDVVHRLANMVEKPDLSRVEIGDGGSLHDIMKQMSKLDLAVVSRYHNLVCSLKLERPTISIGYARKNEDLMIDFHQEGYCQHIETFEVDKLKATFSEILNNRESIRHQISVVNERWQSQLLEQQRLLNHRLFQKNVRLEDHSANEVPEYLAAYRKPQESTRSLDHASTIDRD
jgi:polysaccharide pyruvyl transferase WcaK-like protein